MTNKYTSTNIVQNSFECFKKKKIKINFLRKLNKNCGILPTILTKYHGKLRQFQVFEKFFHWEDSIPKIEES
jgi:hypothetical protein